MLESTVGITGRLFHASDTVGVTPGKKVSVAVRVGRAMGVGRRVRVGTGVINSSEGDASLLLVIFCVGALVEDGMDLDAGTVVASAAHDTNKIQNNKCTRRFIGLSISMKN